MDILEITPNESYEMLQNNKNAILVDVRTNEEFSAYGIVDLDLVGKNPILLPWRTLPDMAIDGNFSIKLAKVLDKRFANSGKNDSRKENIELLFICAGGVRSREAATLFSEQEGYKCYNITTGFEGDKNKSWKAEKLPWRRMS